MEWVARIVGKTARAAIPEHRDREKAPQLGQNAFISPASAIILPALS
jgi:hypothetical protein